MIMGQSTPTKTATFRRTSPNPCSGYLRPLTKDFADAQYAVAITMISHLADDKDDSELEVMLKSTAFQWLNMAALQDHVAAQFCLGLYHMGGFNLVGFPQDTDKAIQLIFKTAQLGLIPAQLLVASFPTKADDFDFPFSVPVTASTVVKWLSDAAIEGWMTAEFSLGEMYDKGTLGASECPIKALGWYLKAAEHGCAEAQSKVAQFYEEGRGVLANRDKAIEWYRKAAKGE
ncbi:hypothetical protein BGZ96_006388 [Linnemannia gamsii]|uniref:HCP-like protein n=1 Tax=Linnemannia gamsii TaxID=64522 RepID=A0ABQ7K394_9FUNG|nr:hypothetical protein BGZ96_006388 [Linnemannia gamsii]